MPHIEEVAKYWIIDRLTVEQMIQHLKNSGGDLRCYPGLYLLDNSDKFASVNRISKCWDWIQIQNKNRKFTILEWCDYRVQTT